MRKARGGGRELRAEAVRCPRLSLQQKEGPSGENMEQVYKGR